MAGQGAPAVFERALYNRATHPFVETRRVRDRILQEKQEEEGGLIKEGSLRLVNFLRLVGFFD